MTNYVDRSTYMKLGIITLESDNYGNKYQNYAVEQLLLKYGEVETFSLASLNNTEEKKAPLSLLKKVHPKYIRDVLRFRMMYRYDITNTSHSFVYSLLYVLKNHKKLLVLKQKRSENFKKFQDFFFTYFR